MGPANLHYTFEPVQHNCTLDFHSWFKICVRVNSWMVLFKNLSIYLFKNLSIYVYITTHSKLIVWVQLCTCITIPSHLSSKLEWNALVWSWGSGRTYNFTAMTLCERCWRSCNNVIKCMAHFWPQQDAQNEWIIVPICKEHVHVG